VKYVYAVTSSATRVPTGLGVVVHGKLAAVTRDVEAGDLRARRRDLLEHADVVRQVFDYGTVVPLQFGVVLDDVVAELLEPRQDELLALLRELDGLVEVTIRAVFREEDVLRELLREQPALARMRGTAPPVQLGEAVARALAARRAQAADELVRTLERHAQASAVDELRTELDVFRGAFLVDRARLRVFDAELDRFAQANASTTSFKVTGPLPPHHFVQLAGVA
jgi:hypothetical protein